MKINQIIYGDNRKKLKEFTDNFFACVITDPPYEMNFMGKEWDSSGIAYDISMLKEVIRVTKPESFLLCFGGTRTEHRVACAIEDAGWQIKDKMMWLYGQGFPKSTNISKQIDKEAGAEREQIVNSKANQQTAQKGTASHGDRNAVEFVTAPATNFAKQWEGYGTGLKPAWEPIIVAMKPLEKGLTFAKNAEKWGVAGLNIDGGRIEGTKPQAEGRWPANLILNEEAGEMLDKQSSLKVHGAGNERIEPSGCKNNYMGHGKNSGVRYGDSGGASRFFYCAKASKAEKEAGLVDFIECVKCERVNSKTHTTDGRKENCYRNNHPTVKPLALMKYLCTLLKMPNKEQVILDPFCGSGTTLIACKELEVKYIGIEQDMDSYLIAITRVGG